MKTKQLNAEKIQNLIQELANNFCEDVKDELKNEYECIEINMKIHLIKKNREE